MEHLLKLIVVGLIGSLAILQAAIPESSTGRDIYLDNCASCHGVKLNGAFGPPLLGAAFHQKWARVGSEALLNFVIATMPPAKPGSLTEGAYVDSTNFI